MCYYEIPVGQDLVLKAMDKLRDNERGLGRFDSWLNELESSLGGRGRMGSMVGASEDFKKMAVYGSPDNQLTEYVVKYPDFYIAWYIAYFLDSCTTLSWSMLLSMW